MSQDLVDIFLLGKIRVIDTFANQYQIPNTSSTLQDATIRFVENIIKF